MRDTVPRLGKLIRDRNLTSRIYTCNVGSAVIRREGPSNVVLLSFSSQQQKVAPWVAHSLKARPLLTWPMCHANNRSLRRSSDIVEKWNTHLPSAKLPHQVE